MPQDDLLRFIGGPLPPSAWWLVLAAVLVAVVVLWWVGVMVWTLSPYRLRAIPIIRNLHARLTRRRFVRAIEATTRRHRTRELSAAQTVAAHSRTVRGFLFLRTGIRAQYLHLDDIAAGELASAAPLLTAFHDVQFNVQSRTDVIALGRSAEELIRRWS